MKFKLPVDKISIYALLLLIAFVIADLGIMSVRDQFLPNQAPPAAQLLAKFHPRPDRSSYNVMTGRNIFNADQKIPDPYGTSGGHNEHEAAPVLTNLPITLSGTIVHVNPAKSVATINLKNKNDEVALRVDGIIPDNAGKITKIERTRVIFRNSMSQRLEFIEMKDELPISFNSKQPVQNGDVIVHGDTEFEMKRSDIAKYTSNLPELLRGARAVPRMGPNGQVECFNLAEISPNSIYTQLGLKVGDCIDSVNGMSIRSPSDAMEAYGKLQSAGKISVSFDRGGNKTTSNYTITQ